MNTKITKDLHLKARWLSDPIMYTIFYKIGDQVWDMQEVGRDGYYVDKPTNPTKPGSAFVYWCEEGEDMPFDFETTVINKNVTLKARFLVGDMPNGQIKFYLGIMTGNSFVTGITSSQQQITASAGDTISLPKLNSPVGYDFLGWANATTGEKYLVEDYSNLADYKFTYDGNALVLYALWD